MDKLISIFAEVLEIEESKINPNLSKNNVEQWDSFSHLRLIAEIEEQFGITIPFEDVPKLNKVKDFLKYIKS